MILGHRTLKGALSCSEVSLWVKRKGWLEPDAIWAVTGTGNTPPLMSGPQFSYEQEARCSNGHVPYTLRSGVQTARLKLTGDSAARSRQLRAPVS